jgi:amidase
VRRAAGSRPPTCIDGSTSSTRGSRRPSPRPSVALPPPRIGAFRDLPPAEAFAAAARLGAFTAISNLTGLPAASLPMGRTAAGLPMGLQIVGGPFAERDVLALSWELEDAMPWERIAPRPG